MMNLKTGEEMICPVCQVREADQSIGECMSCYFMDGAKDRVPRSKIDQMKALGFELLGKWESDENVIGVMMKVEDTYALIVVHGSSASEEEFDEIYLNQNDVDNITRLNGPLQKVVSHRVSKVSSEIIDLNNEIAHQENLDVLRGGNFNRAETKRLYALLQRAQDEKEFLDRVLLGTCNTK